MFQPEVDGDTATTRRKDEINRCDLKRTWPNHTALLVGKLRDPVNRKVRYFALPVSYRQRRLHILPCAAMTATSWCSALQKTHLPQGY
jgi:hypothetical protein